MKKRGKSGRSSGSATRRCKAWRTSPWGYEEPGCLEEGLPQLKEESFERTARSNKGYHGSGMRWRGSLIFCRRKREEMQ